MRRISCNFSIRLYLLVRTQTTHTIQIFLLVLPMCFIVVTVYMQCACSHTEGKNEKEKKEEKLITIYKKKKKKYIINVTEEEENKKSTITLLVIL